jgi:GNAT superfamily N-acetyltransferase
VTTLDRLDASTVGGIAALCARALERPPTAAELAATLFAPDQPATVRGDPAVGVVATVATPEGGHIRLLAVDPSAQRNGHGTRLLEAAEADLSGGRTEATTITVGADPPYYLFAGVETTQTPMLCLLERQRYFRHDANFNMDVDLSNLPPRPDEPALAGAAERDEVEVWLRTNWDNWRPEALRALDKGTLIIGRDAKGITGFCAWDVNRAGLVGPVAVRLDLLGKGAGYPLLVAALHRIRQAGHDRVEVSWVGPIRPYAAVGGTIGRVFLVFRKIIQSPSGGP